jgi:hypothetical protein
MLDSPCVSLLLVGVLGDEEVGAVSSWNHLIKTVARARAGRVRKVRADGLHLNINRIRIFEHQLALDRGTEPCRAQV